MQQPIEQPTENETEHRAARAGDRRRAILVALLFAVVAIAIAAALHITRRPPLPPAPLPVAVAATQQQAQQSLQALPELAAWADFIEKKSAGKAHGAVMATSHAPKVIAGAAYWPFDFIESGAETTHRWESFLVDTATRTVLVDDLDNDKRLTLAQWRSEQHPLERLKD